MNSRATWVWLVIAAGLAAFVFWVEPRLRPPPITPQPVLPGFNARAITNLIIQPAGAPEIRLSGTNGAWKLERPLEYPALGAAPGALLTALEQLMPEAVLSGRAAREQPAGVAAFGLEPAQISLTLYSAGQRYQLLFGTRTAPGDQVFLQVVGAEEIFVVNAELLRLLPTRVDAWRDPALVPWRQLAFNRITVTNGASIIDLQLISTNQTWRMLRPRTQRADSERVTDLLANLVKLRARQFVTDDPATDLEAFGLQPPALSVGLSLGTNVTTQLHFGKSPTNDAKLVYARLDHRPAVVTVERELITPWLAPVSEYRDRQLLALPAPPDEIVCGGEANFTLQRQPDQSWRVAGETFPADPAAVGEFLTVLTNLTITNFVQDVVIDAELPKFGLAPPKRTITLLRREMTAAGATNPPLAQLAFGPPQGNTVLVRRADEDSIYEVPLGGYATLPTAPFQWRPRPLWQFTEADVQRITIRQGATTRTVLRQGTNSWALAPGSQGEIFSEAIEETVHRLGQLTVLAWISRGEAAAAPLGFGPDNLTLTLQLQNGTQHAISFGGPSPAGYPCAAVTREGELWVGEIPIGVHYLVRTHLASGAPPR